MLQANGRDIDQGNLITLGEAVIASMPEADRRNAPSPLKAGFNNLNVTYEGLKEALASPLLAGKSMLAIGKSECESLRWNDHTIADKKTVINEAALVFTASENPEAYAKARNALARSGVNTKLLDCSDAHSLSALAVRRAATWCRLGAGAPMIEGKAMTRFRAAGTLLVEKHVLGHFDI